jgi:hypothetical protein
MAKGQTLIWRNMKKLIRSFLFASVLALTSTAYAGLVVVDVNNNDTAVGNSQNLLIGGAFAVSWTQPSTDDWTVQLHHVYGGGVGQPNTTWQVTAWRGTLATIEQMWQTNVLVMGGAIVNNYLDLFPTAGAIQAGTYFMMVTVAPDAQQTAAGWIDGDYGAILTENGITHNTDYSGVQGALVDNGAPGRGFAYHVEGSHTPEPSSYFLLAAGLCSLGLYRMRRKTKA